MRRSGARGIEVRYWSDTERGSMRIEKRDKRKKKGKRSSDLGAETPKTGECPFRRTDISMQDQYADIALHNSRKSLKDYDVGIDG